MKKAIKRDIAEKKKKKASFGRMKLLGTNGSQSQTKEKFEVWPSVVEKGCQIQ